MHRILWSRPALLERDELEDFNLVNWVDSKISNLADFPHIGPKVEKFYDKNFQIHQLTLQVGTRAVVYLVWRRTVTILALTRSDMIEAEIALFKEEFLTSISR